MALCREPSRPPFPYQVLHHCRVPSVGLAKVYLWQTCSQIYQIHPSLVVSSWVDDISIDMVGKSPQFVAKILAQVLNKLDIKLQELNLILSKHKSGFLVSSNELKKALKEALPKDAPAIKGVLKDLGCDSTGGRLRRLPTQKARLQKGKRRLTRLRALPKKHGKRFTYTSIMPAVKFGHQTLGYSKTQIQKLRVMVGQTGAIRQGNGCLHTATRTVFSAKYDPGIYMPTEHFIMVFKFLQRKSHIQLKMYNQVWQALGKELYSKPNHWSLVKGPLAACIAYLKEHKWQAPDMHKWIAPDGSQWELDFKDPDLAWEFTEQFQGMAEATGWAQSAKRPGSQGLAEGGDLTVGKRHRQHLEKTAPTDIPILDIVLQGALFNHAWFGLEEPCPLCKQTDTLYHRLWQCPEMLKLHPIPKVWETHVADNSYWCRGIPPKFMYEVEGGGMSSCHRHRAMGATAAHPNHQPGLWYR